MRAGTGRQIVGSIDRLFRVGTSAGLSDGQLLERFAARHDEAAEAAFAAIVERHGSMVMRVCRNVLNDSHEAQDAFQATFLVLMRKARSVRQRDSLSSWLYGVARRVSAQSLQQQARRRTVERSASAGRSEVEIATTEPADRAVWDEVDQLPESLRSVVVACYLEGLTHDQAALRLGWPVGTVRSRLARARDRLRGRLARRGLAPVGTDRKLASDSTAGLALLLRRPETLPLPTSLIDKTARAALLLAANDAAESGLVSATAAALSEGVIHTMYLAKLKTASLTLLATGAILAGAAVYARTAILDDVAPEGGAAAQGRTKNDDIDRQRAELREQIRRLEHQVQEARAAAEAARRESAESHLRRSKGNGSNQPTRSRRARGRRASPGRACRAVDRLGRCGSPREASSISMPPQPPEPPHFRRRLPVHRRADSVDVVIAPARWLDRHTLSRLCLRRLPLQRPRSRRPRPRHCARRARAPSAATCSDGSPCGGRR
ncbi:MAG: sigma-70 family RNA polymerase sigma factor [Isosphaeraceae bacterium]